jgi:phenylalanyl-tRNA synthetase alpha chain
MEELKKLIQQAKDDFSKVSELADLDHVKSKYLGKQGPLTEAMKGLSGLPSKEKPIVGSLINDIKKSIEKALGDRKTEIQVQLMNDQLKNENIDVTLSGKKQNNGTLHPISITIKKIESIFNTIGFQFSRWARD